MDPLILIADAVVADLRSVENTFGVAFDLDRDYAPPMWDLENHTEAENRKPKVYVSAVADEGEDDTRERYTHRPTIQIVVGAWTANDRGHNDGVVTLARGIADRYLAIANRRLTYDADKTAIILSVTRPLIYDVEQLRSFGVLMGAINLAMRFEEDT